MKRYLGMMAAAVAATSALAGCLIVLPGDIPESPEPPEKPKRYETTVWSPNTNHLAPASSTSDPVPKPAQAGRIRAAIEAAWRRPGGSLRGLKAVIIKVRVSSDGYVLNARIVEGSGDAGFDASAKQAVWKASPLPISLEPAFYDHMEFRIEFNPDEMAAAAETERAAANALSAAAGRIRSAIEANWRRPGESLRGLKVVIELRVGRTGAVQKARIVESSGDDRFDESAELAIQKASPLPIPEEPEYYDHIKEFRIEFNPDE